MSLQRSHNTWVIIATILVAAWLNIFPLPFEWRWWRPDFVALVLIYWAIALPLRVGLGTAWASGLLMDVLTGTVLGQHCLGYLVLAYVCQLAYQRLRNFTAQQQIALVFVLVGLVGLIGNWVGTLAGRGDAGPWFLLPAVLSALLWPLCFWSLRWLRRAYHVS